MPDKRKHRGPHPQDLTIFAQRFEPTLREATCDLNWLLSRGYASTSSLKLVGDRYALDARQRLAISRCACSDRALARRRQHEVPSAELAYQNVWIDGYNVLTSLEAALAGAVILHARDGCYRDMASMHGSYRKVAETVPALGMLGDLLFTQWKVAECHWLLDEPVSNSGRLKSILEELGLEYGWNWSAELVRDPDALLVRSQHIVASADSQVIDKAERWFNLARSAIECRVPDAWIVDLSM